MNPVPNPDPASHPLGLDEILIVNPRPAHLQPLRPIYPAGRENSSLYLGDDGLIYALHGPADPLRPGDLLLGADGAIYRLDGLGAATGNFDFIG